MIIILSIPNSIYGFTRIDDMKKINLFLFYFFAYRLRNVGKLVPFTELTVAHASILTILAISFER
jgi:hypothetical protein